MAYTSATMQAILPGLGSMPEIGSVAANFAARMREEEVEETREFLTVDSRASFIRYTFGEALFDDYQADMAPRTSGTASSPTKSSKKCKSLVRKLSRYLKKLLGHALD